MTLGKPEFWAVALGKMQRTSQRANETWQRRKTELPMDRNGTGFIFPPLTFRAFCLAWPAVGAPVGRCLLLRGACTACLRADGDRQIGQGGAEVGRGSFGIPCIPAREHKCPVPDINQLFQERREGFSLWNTLPAGPECTATRNCEMAN